MRFVSTRGPETAASLSRSIEEGLAPDGGLYVPERLPSVAPDDFAGAEDLPSIGVGLLRPFAAGDPLDSSLEEICREAFTFPAPLVALGRAPGRARVLELFHGPTSAFKDFGARFLAACLARLRGDRKVTILVATSGDTGAAVAAAFPRFPAGMTKRAGRPSSRRTRRLACA